MHSYIVGLVMLWFNYVSMEKYGKLSLNCHRVPTLSVPLLKIESLPLILEDLSVTSRLYLACVGHKVGHLHLTINHSEV